MNLSERNPGCRAEPRDNGINQTLVPVCMGGASVAGADVTLEGCNNKSICRPQLVDGLLTVNIVYEDASNPEVVARVLIATRASAVTPTPTSYQGA